MLLRRLSTAAAAASPRTTLASPSFSSRRSTLALSSRRSLSSSSTPPAKASPVVPFAIAFDIDGVLVRGGKPIPGAGPVLEYLVESQASPNVARRLPFIFITNGGGCLEEAKATELCDVFFPGLPHPIRSSQILLSHTPMRSLLPEYKDKQILALGSKDYATVCRSYGFQNVVTVEDVLHAHPELYPFKTYHKRHDLHKDPFSAIFILHDPVDWAPEIQVLCDLLEHGVLTSTSTSTTSSSSSSSTGAKKGHIPVYSSNSDLVFSSSHGVPRLAQGAFLAAWEAVYEKCYGGTEIEITRFGKPWESSYRHAEKMLVHEARLLGLTGKDPPPHEAHPHKDFPIKRVYAIGDNPLSDVEGANRADGHLCEWISILVQTGVFNDATAETKAKWVVSDVAEAFRLILKLEKYQV